MKDNYDFSQGKRGAVLPIPSHQTKITILMDNDILEWLGEQIDQISFKINNINKN